MLDPMTQMLFSAYGGSRNFPGSGSLRDRSFSGRGSATGGQGQQQQFVGPDAAGRIDPYGSNVAPAGRDISGMSGGSSKGKGLHGYYRFGAIPIRRRNLGRLQIRLH